MKGTPESDLKKLLETYKGLEHLSVRRHGNSLTLYSTGKEGQQEHAKFTFLGGAVWGLSLPLHTGRWEKTPFTGSLEELLGTLIDNFGFHLERI